MKIKSQNTYKLLTLIFLVAFIIMLVLYINKKTRSDFDLCASNSTFYCPENTKNSRQVVPVKLCKFSACKSNTDCLNGETCIPESSCDATIGGYPHNTDDGAEWKKFGYDHCGGSV